MNELQNPHDSFARAAFSRLDVAGDFLLNYLPTEIIEQLNLETLKITSDSFIDEDLRPHHTDLLYRVNLKSGSPAFVYVLLEHKSFPDEQIAFQLLRYMIRIWEQFREENKGKLPPIAPLVLYHGKRRWRASLRFADLIAQGGAYKQHTPNFEYILCDLSDFSIEEIKGAAFMRMSLSVLKHIFAPDLKDKLDEIFSILRKSKDKNVVEFLGIVLRYLSVASDKISQDDLRTAIKNNYPKLEDEIMGTPAQEWIKEGIEQGLQQGLQQGVQQGKHEGVAETTMRLLQKRLGAINLKTRDFIVQLSLTQLEDLSEALLDFKTKRDLTRWLQSHTNFTSRPN